MAQPRQPVADEAQPYFNRPGSAYVMNLSVGSSKPRMNLPGHSNNKPTHPSVVGRPQFNEGDVLEEES